MIKMKLEKIEQDLLKVLLSNAFVSTNDGPKNAYERFFSGYQGWDNEGEWCKYYIKEIEQFETMARIRESDPEEEDEQATLKILIVDLSGKESDCEYEIDENGGMYTEDEIFEHPLYLFLKSLQEKEAIRDSIGATSEPTQSGRRKGRL